MVYAASDPEVSEGVCSAGYREKMPAFDSLR